MCWTGVRMVHHQMTRTARPVIRDDVRIGDAERDQTISVLSRHTGDGRLTLEEFEDRVAEVLSARTAADLQHALRELPVDTPSTTRRSMPGLHVPTRLLTIAIVIVAVLAVGPWVLWFAIPLVMCRPRHRHHHHHRQLRSAERHTSREHDELTLV